MKKASIEIQGVWTCDECGVENRHRLTNHGQGNWSIDATVYCRGCGESREPQPSRTIIKKASS